MIKSEGPKVLKGLDIKEGSTCLEIGSGFGIGALLINQYLNCRRLVCLDIDPAMIEAARRYISQPPAWASGIRTDNIEFIVGDAIRLPFAESTFDAAFHIAVLDHIKEWRRVIAEVFRVLKPGGVYSFEDVLLPNSPFLFHGYLGHVPIGKSELYNALLDSGFLISSFEKVKRSSTCFVRVLKPV